MTCRICHKCGDTMDCGGREKVCDRCGLQEDIRQGKPNPEVIQRIVKAIRENRGS